MPPGSRAATALALAVGAIATPGAAAAELPLGPDDLHERRTTETLASGLRWTAIVRRGRGDGPWRVQVLEIDRARAAGRLGVVLANEVVPGLERTSAMARRHRAIAGVNGGYFSFRPGHVGDPVGVLVVDGRLVSEPVGARSALLVPRDPLAPVRVAALRFRAAVSAGGRRRLVDGVDRARGRIPGCGGVGGDLPTERPNPFLVCTDASELVVLTPRYGARTGTGPGGWEAVVRRGVVTALRRGGDSPIPRDGLVLSGTGDAAAFLRAAARPGSRPDVDLGLRAGAQAVRPEDFAAIAGGGPRLLRAGRVDVTAAREVLDDPGRAPRTLAGVRADGRVLLVTVDGRRPGWSVGATLREAAATMRALGAREALSLDTGGSTTMVVRGRVVNRPSDPGGERPVSDGLFVLPSG